MLRAKRNVSPISLSLHKYLHTETEMQSKFEGRKERRKNKDRYRGGTEGIRRREGEKGCTFSTDDTLILSGIVWSKSRLLVVTVDVSLAVYWVRTMCVCVWDGCTSIHVARIPFHHLLLCQYADDLTSIIDAHTHLTLSLGRTGKVLTRILLCL